MYNVNRKEWKQRLTFNPLQNKSGNQCGKTPLREGFTDEERKELQYAVSIADYVREKSKLNSKDEKELFFAGSKRSMSKHIEKYLT